MYLMQIIAATRGTGCCGGSPEGDVTHLLAASNQVSYAMASAMLDLEVRAGTVKRVYCNCSN